jgi:sugar phosphate isomerase/epimerase
MSAQCESANGESSIGFSILQGRLTPPFDGEQQYFPYESWATEFEEASQIGFSGIEWLVDLASVGTNPLFDSVARAEILELQSRSALKVTSVDADVFKEGPIDSFCYSGSEFLELFELVATGAHEIGAQAIVVPLIENSAIQNREHQAKVVSTLRQAGEIAERNHTVLALETDLAHQLLLELLDEIGHQWVGACVDVGNMAAIGLPPQIELENLNQHVRHVHIKDRILNSGNVPLGTGDVDLAACLEALSQIEFTGTMTFETVRGDNPKEDARTNLRYMNKLVSNRRR